MMEEEVMEEEVMEEEVMEEEVMEKGSFLARFSSNAQPCGAKVTEHGELVPSRRHRRLSRTNRCRRRCRWAHRRGSRRPWR